MDVYEKLAGATVQIVCGSASGSGFHFHKPGIIVTCFHVIEDAPDDVEAVTERGDHWKLDYVDGSETDELDFAIYRVRGTKPKVPVLQAESSAGLPRRGRDVAFAGFPHGIQDLLIQRAVVAGQESIETFYMDGSVNEGNSGGPIVDVVSGKVVGVVTGTRFPGAGDLDAMASEAGALYQACVALQGGGQVVIMGINFGAFAALVARTNLLLRRLLEANANSGIGIGLRIDLVAEELKA